jgi:hypothetical protein
MAVLLALSYTVDTSSSLIIAASLFCLAAFSVLNLTTVLLFNCFVLLKAAIKLYPLPPKNASIIFLDAAKPELLVLLRHFYEIFEPLVEFDRAFSCAFDECDADSLVFR